MLASRSRLEALADEPIYPNFNSEIGPTGRHETRPFVSLLILSESIRKHQSTLGVTKTGPSCMYQS
jgi:hypothetical protein